jgi:two-component system, OmpR family, sensor histidine kinase VicK
MSQQVYRGSFILPIVFLLLILVSIGALGMSAFFFLERGFFEDFWMVLPSDALPYVFLGGGAIMLCLLTSIGCFVAYISRYAKQVHEKAILATFPDGLLEVSGGGKIVLANTRIEEQLGVEAKKLLGKSIHDLSFLPPDRRDVFASVFDVLNATEETSTSTKGDASIELSLVQPKEQILHVKPIKVTYGGHSSRVITLHDITRERNFERMKTEFVTVAAHQLRTPLSAVKWVLQMAIRGELGQITQDQKNFLQQAYDSNQRMVLLVTDLLQADKIEAGGLTFEFTPTNVIELVDSVVEEFSASALEQKIEMHFDHPERLPLLSVDPVKLRDVFENLVANGLQYTLPGGKIVINLESKGDYVLASVADSGIGIPEKENNQLFKQFFRGTNAIKMVNNGSGLGLYIARDIVLRHGGKIWFESKEGEGTVFYFTMPVNRQVHSSRLS